MGWGVGGAGHTELGCCTLLLPAASMSSLLQHSPAHHLALRDLCRGPCLGGYRSEGGARARSRSLLLLFLAVDFPFLVTEPHSHSETGVPFNCPNCKTKQQSIGKQRVWVAISVGTLKGSCHL